ncbi:hypothetical protein A176_007256 [Myxococcus hansupus]|uniref:Uncharacterized protein n=1 Tax=Pseudomyxococcus hansupus TaxID=1297742 RepID=A0A0H4X525_9BACT|nr:hypothetical protein A176_007256 [Myxococcus hansupus]
MLNAFRHHGERDLKQGLVKELIDACSTPSGITASATRHRMKRKDKRPVLNAFRHHGERDWLKDAEPVKDAAGR